MFPGYSSSSDPRPVLHANTQPAPGPATGDNHLASLRHLPSIDDPLDLDLLLHDPADPLLRPTSAFPTSQAPPTTNPHDLDALLDEPLNAALVAAQLAARPSHRPRKPLPHPALPPPPLITAPIAKPKQKKLRPKDHLDTLQKHLETVVDQVKFLSLRNRGLHKRKWVLEILVAALDHCQALSEQAQRDLAHHRAHPWQPPHGAAVFKDWTPQHFIAYFKAELGKSSKLMLDVDEAVAWGRPPPPDAMAQLQANHAGIMDVVFHVSQQHDAFIPKVMAEMLKHFPATASEDEHWWEVLAAMELTEQQVEDVLAAREVFFSIIQRLEHEQAAMKATVHQTSEQAQAATTFKGVLNMEEELLAHLVYNFRKNANMGLLIAMHVFLHALTPLQVAKCALHSHPLFPDPIIIMNAIYAKHGQAPGTPPLGPQALHSLASARTTAASLPLYPGTATPPLPLPSPAILPPAGAGGGLLRSGSSAGSAAQPSTSTGSG